MNALHRLLRRGVTATPPEVPRAAQSPAALAAKELADHLLAEGNRAEAAGDLDAARANYLRAITTAPDHAPAHLNLGIALANSGDATGAIRSYEQALALDPR